MYNAMTDTAIRKALKTLRAERDAGRDVENNQRLIDSMIGVPPVIWTQDVFKQLLVELVEDANLTGLHSSTLDGIMGYMVSNRN